MKTADIAKASRRALYYRRILVWGLVVMLNLTAWMMADRLLVSSARQLEAEQAKREAARVSNVLAREAEHLRRFALTRALRLAVDGHGAHRQSSASFEQVFSPAAMASGRIDAIMIVDRKRKVIFERHLDAEGQPVSVQPGVRASTDLLRGIPQNDCHELPVEGLGGLSVLSGRSGLLAVAPIRSGYDCLGMVVALRRLDAERLELLEEVVKSPFTLQTAPSQVSAATEVELQPLPGGELLRVTTTLPTLSGSSSVRIILDVRREIMQHVERTAAIFLWSVALLSLSLAYLVWWLLRRMTRESERELLLDRLVQRSGEAVMLFRDNGQALEANPRACVLLGVERRDVRTHSAETLLRSPDGSSFWQEIQHALQLEPREYTLLTNSGGEIVVEASLDPVQIAGEPHFLLLLRDVTERRRLQQDAERISRLAALGELSAGVAHEINNPNGMIQRNLGFVRDVLDDVWPLLEARPEALGKASLGGLDYGAVREMLPQLLDDMCRGSRHISDIVRDMKDFARQEDLSDPQPFALVDAVDAAIRLLDGTIRRATDRFEWQSPGPLPRVCGNIRQIEQVVLNLVLNACQSLPERHCGITVSAHYDQGRRCNILEVQDEGSGITPEHLGRVTDPFFTTRREQGGTGLGLSVSARIVRQHRGTLHFQSEPGRGTRVTLTLPTIEEER